MDEHHRPARRILVAPAVEAGAIHLKKIRIEPALQTAGSRRVKVLRFNVFLKQRVHAVLGGREVRRLLDCYTLRQVGQVF